MARRYEKVSHLTKEVFELKEKGYPNSEIALNFNLSVKQVKNLVARENRKRKQLECGQIPQKKGRPKKIENEVAELKMQIELLRNFLYEVGRE